MKKTVGLSHGGCVAFFTNRNVGQCVKALKDFKNPKKAD